MWFKKQNIIAADNGRTIEELKSAAPDGVDYTTSITPLTYENLTIPQYGPYSISNYFYLPTLGRYNNGKCEEVGFAGRYWTSSARGNVDTDAYHLYLNPIAVVTTYDNRIFGDRILTLE